MEKKHLFVVVDEGYYYSAVGIYNTLNDAKNALKEYLDKNGFDGNNDDGFFSIHQVKMNTPVSSSGYLDFAIDHGIKIEMD